MQKTCKQCGSAFEVSQADQAFYAKMKVPEPTLCPDCRQRRRMSFRNERNFYYRKCDLCAKQIISIYHAGSPYTVYCNACWWSDKWDSAIYAREIDWNRPFFEQMKELQLRVPRLALFQKNSENCDYTNHCEANRNCYVCVDTANSEDVFFSKWILSCHDCVDCYNIEKSELCYSAQYQVGSYQNIHTFYSDHCQNVAFLYNCTDCEDCFMCTNLKRKKFCVRNKQLTEDEYKAFMQNVNLGSHEQMEKCFREYFEMVRAAPKRESFQTQCENCSGDCLYQCKNVFDSFDLIESQDCRYCYEDAYLKDCYDVYESAFECELQYECHGCNRGKFLKFAHVSYDISDSEYVDSCHNSSYLFGCVSMRHKKYAILNREYSKEEFEALRARLIEHMKKTGEWGEFFPAELSPFAYNETIALEHFPLEEGAAKALGYGWKSGEEEGDYQGPFYELPDDVQHTQDDLTKGILKCEVTGKLYRIVPQELALYRKLGIAVPRRAPQQRYMDRLALRNPRHLWDSHCSECGKAIHTPYPPAWKQTVLCEACYLKTVY